MPHVIRFRPPSFIVICAAFVLAALCTTTSGCGSGTGQLRAFTAGAAILDEYALTARTAVLDERQAALNAAAADARAAGISDEALLRQEVEAAARAWDANGGKRRIDLVNGFVAAKDALVRAVLLEASKDKPTWSDARVLLRDALHAYQALRAVGLERLPAIPPAVADLVTVRPWREYVRPPVQYAERVPRPATAVAWVQR